jgi:hypothetical protein
MPRRLHRGDHDRARFSIDMMVELVNAGLASASAERVIAGVAQDRGCAREDHVCGRRALYCIGQN